jgi:F-type H+-transporting ATPase subunit a
LLSLVFEKITVSQRLSEMFTFKFVPQTFMALLVMLIILIFAILIGAKVRKAKITDKPKGFLLFGILYYQTMEKFTLSIMSYKYRGFTKYMMVICPYLFICFTIGLTGLPSPVVYLATPLALALTTFGFVHGTAMKENGWGYFKRYIDPFPVFLPINLISMWAPTLALTFRLFGNAISGFCIMNLVYYGLESLSDVIFGSTFSGAIGIQSIWVAPLVTPFLHLYFDLFSGFIQTLVFSMLTLIFVAQEQSEEDENQVIEEVVS